MPVPAPVLGACVSAPAGAVVVRCCFCRCYRHCGCCCHCHCRCCYFLFFALSLLSHAVAVGVLSAGHHRLFHSFSLLLTQQLIRSSASQPTGDYAFYSASRWPPLASELLRSKRRHLHPLLLLPFPCRFLFTRYSPSHFSELGKQKPPPKSFSKPPAM